MHALRLKVVIAVTIFGTLNAAATNEGKSEDPKKPNPWVKKLCEDALGDAQPFARSDDFRETVLAKLDDSIAALKATRDSLTAALLYSIRHRHLGQAASLPPEAMRFGIKSEPLLTYDKIPPIKIETIKALESIEDPIEEGFPYYKRVKLINQRQAHARAVVEADPYFIWLRQNKTDNRVVKQTGFFTLGEDGPTSVEHAVDPVTLLFAGFNISYPAYLHPHLSLVRVIRDLDPELPPEGIKVAQTILNINKMLYILRAYFREYFNSRTMFLGQEAAWDMAFDLKSARKNLAQYYADAAELYGKMFPRSAYEKLGEIMQRRDKSLPSFKVLKIIMGLPADFSDETLKIAIQSLSSSRPDRYEAFLLLAYDKRVNKHGVRLAHSTASILTKIIAIAEATDSDKSLNDFTINYAYKHGNFNY